MKFHRFLPIFGVAFCFFVGEGSASFEDVSVLKIRNGDVSDIMSQLEGLNVRTGMFTGAEFERITSKVYTCFVSSARDMPETTEFEDLYFVSIILTEMERNSDKKILLLRNIVLESLLDKCFKECLPYNISGRTAENEDVIRVLGTELMLLGPEVADFKISISERRIPVLLQFILRFVPYSPNGMKLMKRLYDSCSSVESLRSFYDVMKRDLDLNEYPVPIFATRYEGESGFEEYYKEFLVDLTQKALALHKAKKTKQFNNASGVILSLFFDCRFNSRVAAAASRLIDYSDFKALIRCPQLLFTIRYAMQEGILCSQLKTQFMERLADDDVLSSLNGVNALMLKVVIQTFVHDSPTFSGLLEELSRPSKDAMLLMYASANEEIAKLEWITNLLAAKKSISKYSARELREMITYLSETSIVLESVIADQVKIRNVVGFFAENILEGIDCDISMPIDMSTQLLKLRLFLQIYQLISPVASAKSIHYPLLRKISVYFAEKLRNVPNSKLRTECLSTFKSIFIRKYSSKTTAEFDVDFIPYFNLIKVLGYSAEMEMSEVLSEILGLNRQPDILRVAQQLISGLNMDPASIFNDVLSSLVMKWIEITGKNLTSSEEFKSLVKYMCSFSKHMLEEDLFDKQQQRVFLQFFYGLILTEEERLAQS